MVSLLKKLHADRNGTGQKPHVVVLHVGTNDLDESVLHKDLQNFEQLISLAKETFPSAKIIINSILPRSDFKILNEKGIILNMHLAKLCKKVGCIFIDLTENFPPELFSCDGLHLNHYGIRRLADVITDVTTSLLIRVIPGSRTSSTNRFVPKELQLLVRKKKRKKEPISKPQSSPSSGPPSPSTPETQLKENATRKHPRQPSGKKRSAAVDSDGFQQVGCKFTCPSVDPYSLPVFQPMCLPMQVMVYHHKLHVMSSSCVRPPQQPTPYIQRKKAGVKKRRRMAQARKKRKKKNRKVLAAWPCGKPSSMSFKYSKDNQPLQG
ncbi:uncharacterized protein LOC117293625 [Asterias rubens]|uniref:uncharacterized protein LOC117293625 n=1 Tax=Asterias rubens TaxID=7604 RepID=UPI00145534C6|nr:uncharacterized protein LOC117293625 [Asterias rubens]